MMILNKATTYVFTSLCFFAVHLFEFLANEFLAKEQCVNVIIIWNLYSIAM